MKSGRNSLIYLFANFAAAAVPFLLLPVLVRLIDQAEYGQVAIFQAFTNVALALVGLNTVGAIKRQYFAAILEGPEEKTDETAYVRFISAAMAILAGSLMVAFAVVFALQSWIEALTRLDVRVLLLGLVFAASSFVINIRLSDYQVRGRAMAYGALQISAAATNLTLSLVIVFFFLRSAEGRILGIALSTLAISTLAMVSLWRAGLVRPIIDRATMKEALAFGVPLMPHALGVFLLAMADRFFLNAYAGLATVGLYAAAVQITFLLRVVSEAINKSFQPWVYSRMSRAGDDDKLRAEEGRFVVGAFYQIATVTIFLAGLLALSGPFIATVMLGEDYQEATVLIPILALGTAFHGNYLFLINILLYTRRTGALASTTVLLGLMNVGLLFILVPQWGAQGAAWAFTVASLLRAATVAFLCHKAWTLAWFRPHFRGLRG